MTYSIVWDEHAIDVAARYLTDDVQGLGQLFNAIDLLAGDPRPAGATEYGPPNLRRIHVGRYRALYELNDTSETIVVIHVGRIG